MKNPTKVATALIKSTLTPIEREIKTLHAMTAIPPIKRGVKRIRSAVISKTTPSRNKFLRLDFVF